MSEAGPAFVPGRSIVLAEHDPAWAPGFATESREVAGALGDALVALHHIGSTSIPGICAKPVIDMLAVVTSVERLDAMPGVLDALGYESMGEFGIPGRRYFRKTTPAGIRTHQIHAFSDGSSEIARHLDFRDHLRAHADVARAYDMLKRELAARLGPNVEAYTDAKTDFIRDIERRARAHGKPHDRRPGEGRGPVSLERDGRKTLATASRGKRGEQLRGNGTRR